MSCGERLLAFAGLGPDFLDLDVGLADRVAHRLLALLDRLVDGYFSHNPGFLADLHLFRGADDLDGLLLEGRLGLLGGQFPISRPLLALTRSSRSVTVSSIGISSTIISISSTAGLTGYEFCTAYSASKFGLDGWMEALQIEVSPFGIETMIVNPGFFRTELLTEESPQYAELQIDGYSERRAQQEAFWTGANGKQGGDPAKLAQALITLDQETELPRRFLAGADAVATAEQKIVALQQQIDAYRKLSSSLAVDE